MKKFFIAALGITIAISLAGLYSSKASPVAAKVKFVTNVYVGYYWAPDPNSPGDFVKIKIYVDPGNGSQIAGSSFANGGPNDYSATGTYSYFSPSSRTVTDFYSVMNGDIFQYTGAISYP